MILFQSKCKRLIFLTTLVALSATQSVAQTSSQTNLPTYEDDRIKATGLSASFDKFQFAQASLRIENKTGKDLLLAFEYRGVRAISDSGQSSECGLEGLKTVNGLPNPPDPLQFSRLKPKAKITVSVSNCQSITPASKPNNLSVNIPLVMLENDQYTQFTLDLSDIPIRK